MYKLAYQIKTLSPVIITQSGDTNLTATMDYISGSSILGLFANEYIKLLGKNKNIHEDETFYKWFLKGDLTYNNAYLSIESENGFLTLIPTPLSIQTNKDEDLIINLAETDTNEKTKPIGGYSKIEDEDEEIGTFYPEKQVFFHHYQPDRIKQKNNKEKMIFNYESLSEGQVFYGEIWGDYRELFKFKEIFSKKKHYKLGRSKNAQYGDVQINLLDIEKIDPEIDHDNEVLITCVSPLILENKYGYPEASINLLHDYLQEALGYVDFKIEKCFAKVLDVETFVSAWKMKRPKMRAFDIGSTFKIIFNSWIDNDLSSKLKNLVINGIGERKIEGYGRIVLNAVKQEKYQPLEIYEKKADMPTSEPPETVKYIFTNVVRKDIINLTEKRAIQNAKDIESKFLKKLNTSIIGRLELMLKDSLTSDDFINYIKELRKNANDKLKACRVTKQDTLYDVLIAKKEPNFVALLNRLSEKIENLAQKASFDYKNDQKFREELYRVYWFTFFSTLRKLIKKGGN